VTWHGEEFGLTEARGTWVLPLSDGKVTQLRIDYAFGLVVEQWIDIRIETSFSYGQPGDEHHFDPSDSAGLAPLVGLHQATVTSAEIRKDGRLTVVFADGAVLQVLPDDKYEAFTVNGSLPPVPRQFTFIALPGGGLARM
jgi:hypothetical protein